MEQIPTRQVSQPAQMVNSKPSRMEVYFKYVEDHVARYENALRFKRNNSDGDIDPLDFSIHVAEYSSIMSMLVAEENRLLFEQEELKDTFQEWWDECYVSMRRKLNPPDIAGSKWLSKGEIESEVRVEHKEEYREWKHKLNSINARVSYVESLVSMWKKHSEVLNILSYNVQREYSSIRTSEGNLQY